jgi:ribosomal protein S18 acetylase RimI-like enzyme
MIHVRPMTAADLPLGLYLSRQAGWNQTVADWQRFLDLQPDGCFVAEWGGVPVGTTTTCILGSVAWIAMVLVEESARGRGLGKALLDHALDFLDRREVDTVRLDATPLGQPLYEKLGFVEQFRLARYEGVLVPAPAVPGVAEAPAGQWERLAALDEVVTSTDRRRLLLCLFREQPGRVRCLQEGDLLRGFLAARPGRRAVQLGPCIADPDAGPRLFADAGHFLGEQRVFLDVPVPNEAATRLAEALGLSVQRHLTRMCRGLPRCERVEWLWASSGPEKG